MKIIKTDLSYTIHSKSNEFPDAPVTEIQAWDFQFDKWELPDTSEAWVIIDFGSAKNLNGLAIINANVTDVIIEGNSTSDFSSPSFTTNTVTMEEDPFREDRLYHYFDADDLSAFNFRYLKLTLPNGQTPVDGSSAYSLGGLAPSDQAEDLPFTTNRGLAVEPFLPSTRLDYKSGRKQIIKYGNRQIFWRVNFNLARDESESEQAIRNFFMDEDVPVILNINSEYHEQSGKKNLTYTFQREPQVSYEVAQYGLAVTEGLTLKETA